MTKKQLLQLIIVITAVVLTLTLGACNTVRGVGQDVEAAGSAIEKKAEKKKTY